jgi:hypothetical protein
MLEARCELDESLRNPPSGKLRLRSIERAAAWEIDDANYAHKRNGACPECVGLSNEHTRRLPMKLILAAAGAAAISLSLSLVPAANAKGCIKGAIVGGVAGHMAGHGKLGAAAGCVVGHHEANKKDSNNANTQAPPQQK